MILLEELEKAMGFAARSPFDPPGPAAPRHPLRPTSGNSLLTLLAPIAAILVGTGCGSQERSEAQRGGSADSATTPPSTMDTVEPPTSPRVSVNSADSSDVSLNRSVWIEGGTFSMGTDDSYAARGPAHDVTVSSFWMQEHEVTNAEFRAFDPTHRSVSGPDDHPVAYVQWREAMDYAASLGGSLPTEAQWEYAARGSEGRTYPWGEASPTCELAHYNACEPRSIIPVMSLPAGATAESVYDLAGNVTEWVFDRYGAYESRSVTDPRGPAVGDVRVLRGGAWMLDTTYLAGVSRTSWPEANSPEEVEEMPYIGFRVVWPGDAGPDAPPVPD